MGLFDFLRKPKSDVEKYYEERKKRDVQKQMETNGYVQNAASEPAFRLTVQDVFTITGRGTVVVGQVECGMVKVGEKILLQRAEGSSDYVTIVGIEQFRKMTNVAQAGENVGILLRGIEKKDITKGDVLLKPSL